MTLSNKIDKTMVAKILGDINMTEDDLEQGVVILKQWLTKQPHLPPSASDDNTLKAFIIGTKSVERAKSKLDAYFTCRTKFADPFFNQRDPLEINWRACQKVVCLPGMTPDGYKVMLAVFPDQEEIDDFDMVETCKSSYITLDIALQQYEEYMTSGKYVIYDLANLSIEFTMKLALSLAGQSSKLVQEAYPMRIKGFISFNAPPLAEMFFNTFFKPFFSQKIKDRNFVHSEDHNILKKYIPLEMLPSDYTGGKNPPFDQLWMETQTKAASYRDWLLNEGSQMVDESLRPVHKDTPDQMSGTFRKLQVE